MALVSAIITSARYDLRDTDSYQYTDAEILDYINRSVVQLDAALVSLNSDWVHATESDTDLLSAANSVSVPSDFLSDRSVWIGDDQLIKKSVDYIYYKRKFISATGQPDYYAVEGSTIIFERTSDQAYTTLVIHYNKEAGALETTDSMPFGDQFNQPIREMAVLLAKKRQEYDPTIDSVMYNFFLEAAMGKIIARNFTRRRYKMDF